MKNHRPASAKEAMRPASVGVRETATTRLIRAVMEDAHVDELPVVADDGGFRGMVERRAVERRLYDRGDEDATAAMIAENAVARATPDEPIENAVEKMLAADLGVLPVVSAHGRLEGLLVLDDLRRVPDLVEAVQEGRHERVELSEAGETKVIVACALASAFLGLVAFALWIEGPGYGLPRWVAWADGIAALLGFIGAVTATSREMISIPLWAVAGVGLCFAAAVGHSWAEGAWSTWVQAALGIAFLLMAGFLGFAFPPRRVREHRRAHRVLTASR